MIISSIKNKQSKYNFLKIKKTMANCYCEYCGTEYPNINSLTGSYCLRHPDGLNKGKHKLYEGSEKSKYSCKYCGTESSSINKLTGSACLRHPSGMNKGKHSPAL